MAAAGANPVVLMTVAGHRSMATTKKYLHLAGTVFPAEADALERRLLGARTEVSEAVEGSTDLTAPEAISGDLPSSQSRMAVLPD